MGESSWPGGVEVRRIRDAVVVAISGEHDLFTAPALEETFAQLLATSSHLIVDLSGSDFIDSSTIRVLMTAKSRAEAGGCRFNLVLGSGSIVERALEVTQVLPQLRQVGSVEEALEATESNRAR